MPLQFLEPLKEVLGRYLLDLGGLYALLALIPLILVYLIRPRPKKQKIPALMFLMKERSKWDKSSFFRRIIKDPLILLQILLILIFAITLAKPFIEVNQQILVEKTAIVIDTSASMQTRLSDGQTRFEKAIGIARENLGTKDAIIAIGAIPELVVDNADRDKADSILKNMKPRDTPTNIFDSLLFAGNYVKAKDRVIVISDFIETSSNKDFNAAKNILKSKGIVVEYMPVFNPEDPAKNVGIVDLDVNEDRTSVQIKNFNDVVAPIDLEMEGANLSAKSLEIEPGMVEVVNFPTPGMLSKFSIKTMDGHDDFLLDNDIYISAPSKAIVPLLLISNKISKYLDTALEVIPTVDVTEGAPPKVPEIAHNIIIMTNIRADLMLPGTMKKIKKKVKDGAAFIIVGQENLFDIDFEGLLPVERADRSSPPVVSEEAYVRTDLITSLTEDMNFGRVERYLNARPVKGATTLATVGANTTMIAMMNVDKGLVVYIGLMDDYSDFKNDIYYPVFWKRLFDMALKKQEISDLNYKTGQVAHMLSRMKVTTPNGKVNEEKILLDYQGIYRSDERNFVANLINEKESDINGVENEEMKGVFDTSILREEETPFELTRWALIVTIIFVIFELFWIKFRGDV